MILAALQSTRFVISTTERPVKDSCLKLTTIGTLSRLGIRTASVKHQEVCSLTVTGRYAVGIPQLKTGRFQPAITFEQASPVFAVPDQALDQLLRQLPGIEHHDAERDFTPDGLSDQGDRQRNFGPKLRMPCPKVRILEQHRVNLFMRAIPRIVRQGKAAITVVVVAVHMVKEAPPVFLQCIIKDDNRFGSMMAVGCRLLQHAPDATAIHLEFLGGITLPPSLSRLISSLLSFKDSQK
jgi:hypothetical protein